VVHGAGVDSLEPPLGVLAPAQEHGRN
jgi:hypothetical protein